MVSTIKSSNLAISAIIDVNEVCSEYADRPSSPIHCCHVIFNVDPDYLQDYATVDGISLIPPVAMPVFISYHYPCQVLLGLLGSESGEALKA